MSENVKKIIKKNKQNILEICALLCENGYDIGALYEYINIVFFKYVITVCKIASSDRKDGKVELAKV